MSQFLLALAISTLLTIPVALWQRDLQDVPIALGFAAWFGVGALIATAAPVIGVLWCAFPSVFLAVEGSAWWASRGR